MSQLDPSIILAGRGVNALGALSGGFQLRQQRDEMARQNALAAFAQQNAQGLARGDQNAMAGWIAAGADPQTALGMTATRHGMDINDAQLAMAQESHGWAGETHQAQMDEYERADTLARVQGIEYALGSQDYELAQRLWDEEGLPPVSGPEEMAARLAQLGSSLAVMQGAQPPAPTYREFDGNLYREGTGGLSLEMQGTPDPTQREIRSVDGVGLVEVPPTGDPRVLMPEGSDPAKVVGPNGRTPKEQLDAENAFRDDWTSLPEIKDYNGVSRAYSTIIASAQERTGSGDIALITGLQKLLDPNSVVREQEFSTAANAGGTLAWLKSLQANFSEGDILEPGVREQIVDMARAVMREAEDRRRQADAQWGGIAERAGMSPDDVMPITRYRPAPGALPFSPVAQPQARPTRGAPAQAQPARGPAGSTLPPPIGEPEPQGSQGASAAPARGQAGSQAQGQPLAVPAAQEVARMPREQILQLVADMQAAGMSLPPAVAAVALQRLRQSMGGR